MNEIPMIWDFDKSNVHNSRGPILCLEPSERTQFFALESAAILFKIFWCFGLAALLGRLLFPM